MNEADKILFLAYSDIDKAMSLLKTAKKRIDFFSSRYASSIEDKGNLPLDYLIDFERRKEKWFYYNINIIYIL